MKNNHLHIFLIFLAVLLFSTCQKDYETPNGNNKVVLNASTTNSISYFTVKIKSRLNNTGGYTISDHGLCWGLEPNPDISKEHKSIGYTAAPIDISANINNLQPGKKYYIRSYASIPTGTVYGVQNEFTTLKTGVPVSITDTITNITYTTALCKGMVVADSGLIVTKRGICWSLTPNPALTSSFDTLGKGLGTYNIQIDALNPSTTYYIRAFAVNDSGTSYGIQKSFITVAYTTPVLTTSPITNITTTTAESGGAISFDGGSSIIARGVCWSTSINPSIASSHTSDSSGAGNFSVRFTDLSAITVYHIRAYATNIVGTSYGSDLTFTTLANPVLPSITTTAASGISQSTATSGGNVSSDGGAVVTARGVCWSTSTNPSIAGNHTSDGSGTGSFSGSLTALTANTLYHIRSYATNSIGTSYGNDLTFTTLASPVVPSVTTTTASGITQSTATSGGNVTSDGGASVTARGVCWNTSANPTIASSHTTDGSGTGSFFGNLTGLLGNTLYHIRAYATNSVGTSYGSDLSFTTLANPVLPSVTTSSASNITPNTASSGGNVSFDGGETVSARGVCWSTFSNPTISGSHSSNGTGTGTFVSSFLGLNASTTYYVRAYATNNVGTAYGNQQSFTTLPWACGFTITINHVTGSVAPVDKTITYGTVTNIPGEATKCWITSNLGADHQATAIDDATEVSGGWYWQFNRKQGYKHDGTTRIPNITWITSISENSDWTAANDPCTLEMGGGWRIPTNDEWKNTDIFGNWTDRNGPWNSGLKLHSAGSLSSNGLLSPRGLAGNYYSSTQGNDFSGWHLDFTVSTCYVYGLNSKALGFSLRCIKD